MNLLKLWKINIYLTSIVDLIELDEFKSITNSFKIYDAIKNWFSPKFILSGHIHNPLKTKDKLNNIIIYNPGLNTHKLVLWWWIKIDDLF